MKVGIREISEVTGFSPATISNALNHKKGVNAETAAKIIQAARELGYSEESKISKVKFVMYKKYGNVVEDTPFFPLMIAGVEEECRNCGMDMMLLNLDRRQPDYDELLASICDDRTSAIILLGTELEDFQGHVHPVREAAVVVQSGGEMLALRVLDDDGGVRLVHERHLRILVIGIPHGDAGAEDEQVPVPQQVQEDVNQVDLVAFCVGVHGR